MHQRTIRQGSGVLWQPESRSDSQITLNYLHCVVDTVYVTSLIAVAGIDTGAYQAMLEHVLRVTDVSSEEMSA